MKSFVPILAFTMVGCTSIDRGVITAIHAKEKQKEIQAPVVVKKKRSNLKQKIKINNSGLKKRTSSSKEHDLHLDYKDKHYKFWKNYFSKREKARFQRHMANGELFYDVVKETFKKHGLPEDLFFVGLIESGYNTHIRSRASAVGPWQFIKGTAKRYGLRVDRELDERRNIHKSTEAAAQYFKDLYNIFGSWELALCAYNKGEYGIIRAIRKGNTRDYKELVRKKLIPKETIHYVPKMAAARYLYKQRRKYGLRPAKKKFFNYEQGRVVRMYKSFSQKGLARKLGVSSKTLARLNPDFKTSWIKSKRKGVRVVIPKQVTRKFAGLYSKPTRRVRVSKVGNSKLKTYRVKRGDNLYRIARRLGVSVRELKSINRLRSSKIFVGQKLKVKKIGQSKVHIVKRGDNLSEIARKYRTSISSLLAHNDLRRTTIYRGQKIYIP